MRTVVATLLLLALPVASAAEIDDGYCDKIADAIYKAEGGAKTRHPYGVLSVKVRDAAEARRVCKNTISRVYRVWSDGKKAETFVNTLADVYCPPSADPVGNKNWKKNVNYYLK